LSRFKQAPAITIAVGALVASLGGGAYAATTLGANSVGTRQLQDAAVTHVKLAPNSVWADDLGQHSIRPRNLDRTLARELASHNKPGPQGPKGDTGPQGPKGDTGAKGADGANPGLAVTSVPAITAGSGNPNPDSGAPGDQGFYFTGTTGGTATIAGGELILTGVGVDSNTAQGGVGIAKAYDSVPLSHLDGVSYGYHIGTTNATQAPTVHVTVTGLTNDSHFGSGFANLVYNPYLNTQSNPIAGTDYTADAFLPSAKWYSTTEPNIGDLGGQNNPAPLSHFISNDPSAVITQISLDNGGSSGATGSFEAGVDNLVIGLSGSISRYDFGG
jgi:hypothetical protein